MERLQDFARRHKVNLKVGGTAGFGRPCVGFCMGNSWVEFMPLDRTTYELAEGFPDDERLCAPSGVAAYHKHSCLAVLAEDESEEAKEAALEQLLLWVTYLEDQGTVEVVSYQTNARGAQQIVTPPRLWAIRFRDCP